MKALGPLLSRALDVIDALFEAISALWRVALRGAFTPDAKSYRAARFALLDASDVLVQEIALNASDANEAKKALTLDAERLLPLEPDLVACDVAGPIDTDGRPRARPEQAFILGVVRKDTLERVRAGLPATRRGGVEAFVFAPPAHSGLALVFGDETGARSRRLRRAALAAALVALAITAGDAGRAATATLERRVAAADAERLALDRRIRLNERRERDARAAAQAFAQAAGPRLGDLAPRLNRIALHLPADADLASVTLNQRTMTLSGRAHTPDAAELALRRAFEGEEIGFAADENEPPRTFQAQLGFAPEAQR